MSARRSSATQIPEDVIEIERALTRIAHLLARSRQHDRVAAEAGVPVDRAAVPILRLLAESEPLRTGELAARLAVEAPHVTRQVQRLERCGYLKRVPDPDDGRAHRVQLTPSGHDAIDRLRDVGRRMMWQALEQWSPAELRQLAALFHRMVDDFLTCAAADAVFTANPPPRSRTDVP